MPYKGSGDSTLDSSCGALLHKKMRDGTLVTTHEELVPFMTQNRHMTCVHAAAQLGCLDCLKWMTEHIGLAPNEPDTRYGATALHYAASAGHHKLVKFLLARIVRVKADYDGATPLHDAAVQGHTACVQELLKCPLVDSQVTDNYGLTAVEWAEQAQQKKCTKLIKDSLIRKTSTLSKSKKGNSKKEKHQLPAFSQYSDGTGSSQCSSNSPVSDSETYAQLEPPDCTCGGNPPSLPPRPAVPNTPRPSRLQQAGASTPSMSMVQNNNTTHEEMTTHRNARICESPPLFPNGTRETRIREYQSPTQGEIPYCMIASDDFPPPPNFLDSPPQFPEFLGHDMTICEPVKPVSAVPPFSQHIPARGPSRKERPKSQHIIIGGAQMLSPITTPPAPIQSFSTFSNFEAGHHQTMERHEPDQMSVKNMCIRAGNALSHISLVNAPQSAHDQQNGNSMRTQLQNNDSSIPLWKQHLFEQRQQKLNEERHKVGDWMSRPFNDGALEDDTYEQGRRWIIISTGGSLQAAEVPDIPDWKRLIHERKHAKSPVTSGRQEMSVNSENLSPWQNEIKNSGFDIPINTHD